MDIETLKATIKANLAPADGGQNLALDHDLLGSDALSQLLQSYLEDGQLRIAGISRRPIESADSITVTGQGDNAIFQGMAVSARFSLVDDQAALMLTATPASHWTFASSFPALAGTFFELLEFGRIRWTFASHELSPDVPQGLRGSGRLKLTAAGLENLAWLLGDKKEIDFSGSVNLLGEMPQVAFAASWDQPIPLGFFQLSHMTLEAVSEAPPDAEEDQAAVDCLMRLGTAITFGAQGRQIRIPLGAEFRNPAVMFLLYSDLNEPFEAAFQELSDLMDGADLGSLLPEDLSVGDVVKLENLVLQVAPKERKLVSVRLGITTPKPWPIIQDIISLESLAIAFQLRDPLGEGELSAALFGEIGLG